MKTPIAGEWFYYANYLKYKDLYQARITSPKDKEVPVMDYQIIAKDNASNQKETEQFQMSAEEF